GDGGSHYWAARRHSRIHLARTHCRLSSRLVAVESRSPDSDADAARLSGDSAARHVGFLGESDETDGLDHRFPVPGVLSRPGPVPSVLAAHRAQLSGPARAFVSDSRGDWLGCLAQGLARREPCALGYARSLPAV